MNTEALFLFLILLLGLVLCSFLGGNCGKEGYTNHYHDNYYKHHRHHRHHRHHEHDEYFHHHHHSKRHGHHHNRYDNYNHFFGSSSPITNGTTYYDNNGDSVIITTNANGRQIMTLNQTGNSMPTILKQDSVNSNMFSTSDGTITANIITGRNGQNSIQFNLTNGTNIIFTQEPNTTTTSTTTSSQYFGSTGTPVQTSGSNLAYTTSGYDSDDSHSDNESMPNMMSSSPSMMTSSPSMMSNMMSNSPSMMSNNMSNQYSSSLPKGIPGSQIPPGQEDLYILKSEVVPPVCPVCPAYPSMSAEMEKMKKEKCPPCPACARCPEPSFDCKKVPNYNSINNDYLPEPVLNDFSQFGM